MSRSKVQQARRQERKKVYKPRSEAQHLQSKFAFLIGFRVQHVHIDPDLRKHISPHSKALLANHDRLTRNLKISLQKDKTAALRVLAAEKAAREEAAKKESES